MFSLLFVLFEWAWNVEEQRSGHYNLVSWKIKSMRWRKLTLNQAGLPAATKDELKKIVIYHVTAENAAVCVTKVGHVNSLSIKKIKEKKEIEETEESYRWRFT